MTLVHDKPIPVPYHQGDYTVLHLKFFVHLLRITIYITDETEDFHTLELESHHPGVLRLEGGLNKECETVRNILFGVTGPLAFLDPTAGLVSAGMSVASWQVCNKMATPQREVFSCCGGDRTSAGEIAYPLLATNLLSVNRVYYSLTPRLRDPTFLFCPCELTKPFTSNVQCTPRVP